MHGSGKCINLSFKGWGLVTKRAPHLFFHKNLLPGACIEFGMHSTETRIAQIMRLLSQIWQLENSQKKIFTVFTTSVITENSEETIEKAPFGIG